MYGLHPSAFALAHGCIRLLPFFLTGVGSSSGRNRVQPNATVCIQLREITILEFPSVFRRKSSLPCQARGSRAWSSEMSTTQQDVIHYLSEPGSPLGIQVGWDDHILAQPQRIAEQLSIEALAYRICTDAVLAQRTAELRDALAEGGRKGRYRDLKEQMPAVVPAVAAPPGTATKGISARYHNGLYGFDIDEGREHMDKPAVLDSLIQAPGCVMVGTSCTGDALYAFYRRTKGRGPQGLQAKLGGDCGRAAP